MIGPPLRQALDAAARAPRLLVASDFDGTLAPLTDQPSAARPEATSVPSLVRLADLPATFAAVVSGRAQADLIARLGRRSNVLALGSYGVECEGDVSPAACDRLLRVEHLFGLIAREVAGAEVERKPLGVAFHVRRVGRSAQASAIERALQAVRAVRGLRPIVAADVVEAFASAMTKADAIARLARRVRAHAIVYLGDDRPDEVVFGLASLVGVKVGYGPTRAAHTVADPREAGLVLRHLADARARLQR